MAKYIVEVSPAGCMVMDPYGDVWYERNKDKALASIRKMEKSVTGPMEIRQCEVEWREVKA